MTDDRVFVDETSTPTGVNITIDEFVLDCLFTYVPAGTVPAYYSVGAGEPYDAYWYAPLPLDSRGHGQGWIILWADGNYHHTYHHPGDLYR